MQRALRVRSAAGMPRRARRSAVRNCARTCCRLESGSVTRLCRCEPLLSNRSNKWDGLRQVRLSAQGGLAQFCRQALMSHGCFN